MSINKKEIHPFCKQCLKDHPEWYVKNDKVLYKSKSGEILHICSLINEEINVSNSAKEILGEEDSAFANFLYNPVLWARTELSWEARWYQKNMLLCLSGDQRIFMGDGTLKKIKDIRKNDIVLSYNEIRRSVPSNRVISQCYSGKKDVYRITLENGDSLECTKDHPIFVYYQGGKINPLYNKKALKTGYLSIKNGLSVGQYAYIINKFDKYGNIEDFDLAILLGYLVSDSYINLNIGENRGRKNIIEFCNTNKKYIDEYCDVLKRRFSDCCFKISYFKEREYRGSKKKSYWKVTINGKNNSLSRFLISNAVFSKHNRETGIFNYAFCFSKKSLMLFLNRAYSGDGCVQSFSNRATISYYGGDNKGLEILRILLKKIGIVSSHIYSSKTNKGRVLLICKEHDCRLFLQSVGKIFGKETYSELVLNRPLSKYKGIVNGGRRKFLTSKRTKIVGIDFVGKRDVYDIQVENRNNFIAEGLIVHNCSALKKVSRIGRRAGKTNCITVSMLHHAYTNAGHTILVIAPYQNQIGVIFDQVDNFLGVSTSLKSSIKRNTKNPYRMEFYNGSRILGFTAGTRTGSKSTGIRGQDGHCVVAGTLVNVTEYASKPIELLRITDTVLGGDENGISVGKIQSVMSTGRKKIISLPTVITKIQCTEDHPIFDGQNDIPAKDANEAIVSLAHRDLTFYKEAIKARLAGYVFGDGWINEKSCGFSGQREDLEQIVADLEILGDVHHKITTAYKVNESRGIRGTVSEFNSTWARDLLWDICPHGEKVLQPLSIPESILNGKNYVKLQFLSGLFSAEGGGVKYQKNRKSPRTIDISMYSSKEEWARQWFVQLKELLNSLDIQTSEVHVDKLPEPNRWKGYLRVCNSWDNIKSFVERIGYCYNVRKTIQANIFKIYDNYKSLYKDKESWILNRLIRKQVGSVGVVSKKLGVSCSTVKYHRKLFHPLYSTEIKDVDEVLDFYKFNDHYVKLPIIKESRKYIGVEEVINLQSSAGNRFFANGIFTHNCIMIDEGDFLSPSDFEVILAIQASRPDVKVWVSSTPTGKREMFWRFCTEPELGYKEFHFPSSVSPVWTAQIEQMERAQYSDQGFSHEFLAEWGDVAEGVFLKKFVDSSLQDYDMNKIRRSPDSLYTMGVDWNTAGNGTCIIITEWNKSFNGGLGAFKLVRKVVIHQEEFTQVRACEEIIALTEKWNPEYIYVDVGYGATQIEMLRKYGLEHPKTGLANKVKGIYFGDRMDIRDPVTKQIVKKHMKPFIVNLAARRMEDGQIILPESEDLKNGLVGQIRDYTVIRTTALGQPVYSNENDHAIVAWMLAILAATMEFSDMTKQNRSVQIGIAGRFGEKISQDFVINKQKIQEDRDTKRIITPRWFNRNVFQETTARSTLDFLREKNRKPEGKHSLFSANNLKRSRKLYKEGRTNF
jgi:intein/homing endonuclease